MGLTRFRRILSESARAPFHRIRRSSSFSDEGIVGKAHDTARVPIPLAARKNNPLGRTAGGVDNGGMIAVPLFEQLRRRLRQLLRRRGQTPEDAEDVIQDAFLRLQAYYRKGGEVREPEAFLVRTALRLSINSGRDAGRRVRAEERLRDLPRIETEPAPEEVLAAEQSVQAMNRKLESVSTATREVFLLHRVDGLTYAQISKLYGITAKAVERRIARAMLAVAADDWPQEHDAGSPR